MRLPPLPEALPLLHLDGVHRAFGGIQAVDHLSMELASGCIVGLIGPNGAGKTTVINLVSGLLRPGQGAILLNGHPIHHLAAHAIARAGITRTYQNIRLFKGLSALDNVLVGAHHTRPNLLLQRLVFASSARLEEARARAAAADLLRLVGLHAARATPAGELPYGDQRRLEIARALASRPRLILLDEPAAGLPFAETTQLMDVIRSLPKLGVTVLLVEHNMHLVMNVCDRIVVLNFGKKIAEGTPAEIARDPAVIEAYLGTDEEAPDA